MRARLIIGWLVLFSLVAAIGYAQTPSQPPAPTLSLSEALDIARRNNPTYRSTANDITPARRNLLASTTNLFVPTLSLNGQYFWADAGEQFLQGFSFNGPTRSQKSASLNLGYSISGQEFAARGQARADLRAVEEDATSALTILETSVRTQYLNVLEAQAQEAVARRSLERAGEQLNLARARNAVGQGTLLEVRSAEVRRGTAEVTLLRATQNSENQTLTLYGSMGVPAPAQPRITATDSFPVVAPAWSLDSLTHLGTQMNPALRSLRARENSAAWRVRSARSEYLPSINMNAGTGRVHSYSASFTAPTTDSARLANGNTIDSIPLSRNWSTDPWSFSVGISLPIFDGFGRAARNSAARAAREDVTHAVRARELQVRSDVVSAFNGLQAAYVAVGIQVNNKVAATEALELASQRYRVGSGSYLELLDARVAADQADADHISAVYSYHRAIATLENAVGRPLR